VRVFVDANVLFSAARGPGAVANLMALGTARKVRWVANAWVLEEAQRNLGAKATAASQGPMNTTDALRALGALLESFEIAPLQAPPDAQAELWAWLPAKDQPVLQAAIWARCDALVTGDRKHFGSGYGQLFGGVRIVSPAMLAELLLQAD
jgi:uncharacterized protein